MNYQDYKKTSDSLKKITQFSTKKKVERIFKPKPTFLKKLGLEKPKLSPIQKPSLKFLKKYEKKTPQFTEVTQIIQKDISPELQAKIDQVLNTKQEPDLEKIAEYVFEYIKNAKGNERLDISSIRNHEQLLARKEKFDMNDQRWHGAGNSVAVITGFQVPTGTVNGVNKTFVFTTAPNSIVVDGVSLQKTASDGTINWTGTTTIILSVAPNFDIFGTS